MAKCLGNLSIFALITFAQYCSLVEVQFMGRLEATEDSSMLGSLLEVLFLGGTMHVMSRTFFDGDNNYFDLKFNLV